MRRVMRDGGTGLIGLATDLLPEAAARIAGWGIEIDRGIVRMRG
ncbi:hypothetical protein [Methylobacterium sp. SI9]